MRTPSLIEFLQRAVPRPAARRVQCPAPTAAKRHAVSVAIECELWTDPSGGYTVRASLFPCDVETGDGERLLGFSSHTGVLWCETGDHDIRRKRPGQVHIGPLVKTHTRFTAALLERGCGPDTHYLLGRRNGGFPLRAGSRPAVEALLDELNTGWQDYRRAYNPEYRIQALRAIRRARATGNTARLAALKKRYPEAAAYDRKERLNRARRRAAAALGSVQAVPGKSLKAVRTAAGNVATGSRKAVRSAAVAANGLLATTQGLLASALSSELNALLQDTVSGSATLYDKAMDAVFLETGIGGGNHRIFDGGHTIAGAIRAVRDASPEDTVVKEAMGFLEAMFRDMTTAKGLPLANWDKATYDQVAGYLQSSFGISRDWFYDLNSYDAAELLGGAVGVVAIALCWNRADTENFAKLVGGMGVSSALSANPLLLVVTVVALAKAFHKAHLTGEYEELIDGHLKGGIAAGASLAAVAQVSVLGGPAGVALLAGLSAGVLANKATEKVRVARIGRFLAERAAIVARETRRLADG